MRIVRLLILCGSGEGWRKEGEVFVEFMGVKKERRPGRCQRKYGGRLNPVGSNARRDKIKSCSR